MNVQDRTGVECCPTASPLILPQQPRQLSDVGRNPSGFVPGQQARCGLSPGLRLEVDVGESQPVTVADDVAASVVLFDVPGRREAASGATSNDGDWPK
jgi:hypothetical protein